MREELKIKRDFISQYNDNIFSCYKMKINYKSDDFAELDNIVCLSHNRFFSKNIKIKKNGEKYLGIEILDSYGCYQCEEAKEKFIERSKICHGDKYDYSKIKIKYNYGTDKIKRIFIDNIICPEHGTFSTRSDSWKMGCPRCAGMKLTEDHIIKKLKEIYGNRYGYRAASIESEYFLKYYSSDKRNSELLLLCYKEEKEAKEKGIKLKKIIYDVYCNKHYDYFNIPVKSHLRGVGCPVCAETMGESQTSRILDSLKIPYTRQKTFDDLRYIKKLRFDFYIPSLHCIIEYDGDQHINPVSIWGGEEAFKITQIKDKLKNEYCVDNNIPLLRLTPRDNFISMREKILNFLQIKESNFITKFSKFI